MRDDGRSDGSGLDQHPRHANMAHVREHGRPDAGKHLESLDFVEEARADLGLDARCAKSLFEAVELELEARCRGTGEHNPEARSFAL